MSLTQEEFEALINDRTKKIVGNITWSEDQDHSPSLEFSKEIVSRDNVPWVLHGRYNPIREMLSYAIIHRKVGRIYGLDIGQNHKNPSGERVGRVHKHRWTEMYKDKEAYKPLDITCPATDVKGVWKEFCLEANIQHEGMMAIPPQDIQLNLF